MCLPVLALCLGLLGVDLAQDPEEAIRTCLIFFLAGYTYNAMGGFAGMGPLLCTPRHLEGTCQAHGVIDEGLLDWQQRSSEERLSKRSTLFTILAPFSLLMCLTLLVPVLIYKILTSKIRQIRINRLIDAAKAVERAFSRNSTVLGLKEFNKLSDHLKYQGGNCVNRNLMTSLVLIWNLLFPVWSFGFLLLVTSHFQLPWLWLHPVLSLKRGEEWNQLEGIWFPKQVTCVLMEESLREIQCFLTENEMLSFHLRAICLLMIGYNLVAITRALQVIYVHWTPTGRRGVIMEWLEPLKGKHQLDQETSRAFVAQFAADDLMAFEMIERSLGTEIVTFILRSHYKDFALSYVPKVKVV